MIGMRYGFRWTPTHAMEPGSDNRNDNGQEWPGRDNVDGVRQADKMNQCTGWINKVKQQLTKTLLGKNVSKAQMKVAQLPVQNQVGGEVRRAWATAFVAKVCRSVAPSTFGSHSLVSCFLFLGLIVCLDLLLLAEMMWPSGWGLDIA
jgi:hypothetical protein